jgi:hypothetical protein
MPTDSGCFKPVMIWGSWATSGMAEASATSAASIFIDIRSSLFVRMAV